MMERQKYESATYIEQPPCFRHKRAMKREWLFEDYKDRMVPIDPKDFSFFVAKAFHGDHYWSQRLQIKCKRFSA